MNLQTLNSTTSVIEDTDNGFHLLVTEDQVNKDVSFDLTIIEEAAGFLKKHPFMSGFAAAWAVQAMQQYVKNKRYSTTLYAKNPVDKKLYSRIVDDLMKTGNYKKIQDKFVDGGHLWQLQLIKP